MKAIIRPETEMKESGIEWIGNIPRIWKIRKINSLFETIGSGTTPNSNIEEYYQGMINWLQSGDINGTIVKGTKKHISNEIVSNTSALTVYKAPFIAIAMYGASIGNISIVDIDACTNQACCVLVKPTKDIYMQFAFWGLMAAKEELVLSSRGGGQPNISQNIIKRLRIPVPNILEQENIADYLDETCFKIDEIIAEAKVSIDEYKELKQSVIFEAVTKGLDKNIEMKNSGVDGMGFIPAKWSVVRYMKVNYVRGRLGWKGLKAEEYVDVGYPFLAAYHIVNSHLCWENLNCITKERYDESPEIKLSIGDLVLVKDGAGIGKCARIDDMPLGEATVNSSLSVITPNELLDYRYEYYYFMSPLFQNIITRLKNGMGVPHLTQESMKDIYLPLPSKKEQQAIAEYLDNKVVELDSLIAEKESLINDLEAYKKSLIYEVVTGKRRVV